MTDSFATLDLIMFALIGAPAVLLFWAASMFVCFEVYQHIKDGSNKGVKT